MTFADTLRDGPSLGKLTSLIIVNRGTGYEARKIKKSNQRNKQGCQHLCWKFRDSAESFVLRSYTLHELRNQNVSIG